MRDSAGRHIKHSKCSNGLFIRHWFTEYGAVGNQLDACVRCGAPNPKRKGLPRRAVIRRRIALPARRLLMASWRLPHRRTFIEVEGCRYETTPVPAWFDRAWRFVDWLSG